MICALLLHVLAIDDIVMIPPVPLTCGPCVCEHLRVRDQLSAFVCSVIQYLARQAGE
jgi:hypothetical protein